MSHVLEHVPAARGYTEGRKVTKINPVLGSTPEDVHGIVDKCCGVTFSGDRYVANAFLLAPAVRTRVIGPDVVEPGDTVRAAEEVELVVPCDD